MHPASSVIFFTSLSGLGYGLIVALLVSRLFHLHEFTDKNLAVGLIAGVLIASFGLSLSLFHLGHPERAWRALSQWRSSWLSREGVLALAAFGPVLICVGILISVGAERNPLIFQIISIAAILLSCATVYATAMIYRSLGTISAWHTNWVPLVYISLALMSGFILAAAYLNSVTDSGGRLPLIAFSLIVISTIIKLLYWQHIRQVKPDSTIDTALGLKNTKQLRQLTAPHTQDNYLLEEMGFEIARNHADKLRKICLLGCFGFSLLCLVPYFFHTGKLVEISLWISVIAAMTGVLVERWLFFAEAKHTVTLYYGR